MKNFFQQNTSLLLQIAIGLFFVGVGIYFIRHESAELSKVAEALKAAEPLWVGWGILLLLAFVVVQGMMYRESFAAIHQQIGLGTGIVLYLKRNLVSVFLPAGLLTNMLFFNEEVERKEGVTKTQVYFASTIFSFCSILSSIIVGIPALIWLMLRRSLSDDMVWGMLLVVFTLGVFLYLIREIWRQGRVFQWLEKRVPALAQIQEELKTQSYNRRKFLEVLGLSVIIEIIGIAHLFISIKALGGTPSLQVAIIGYAIVLLLLMSAPFLRGIGAIEVALTYALTLFGFSTVLAISVAFLFRFFEFWSVLVLGLIALVSQRSSLLLRILPASLLFLLGVVNILSAATPALPLRVKALSEILPLAAIHASNWLVLFSGIIMLGLAVYLLRGLRNAWIAAVTLSTLSLFAHLTKGIDWEEALVTLVTLAILLYQRRFYFVRTDLKLAQRSALPGMLAVSGVLLFGTVGFYFMNPHHFNVDFSLWESFQEAISTFFLINIDLQPVTAFGREFLLAMNLLGGLTIAYLAFLLLRPLIRRPTTTAEEDRQKAKALLEQYGRSSQDYFKIYADKHFWFSPDGAGFVSFKTSRNYAIVLENPVCADQAALEQMIPAFDEYCRQNGLRTVYYRIPEPDKAAYETNGKKLLPMGEEAVLPLDSFSMQGKDRSALRNAVNKLTKTGYTVKVNLPPQTDAFLQQLRAVSDDWLRDMQRTEIVFSQGMFEEAELKDLTILSLQNPEGKVVGFLNLIPDYTRGEANFDLMRKTEDAPHGTMDMLFIKLFEYLKEQGFSSCNLGMVPMSGIEAPANLQERVIKWAYERMRQFGHYRSLRDFKDKFDPRWQMMYLAYTAPFDLIYLPNALERVIQPG